MDVDDDLAAAMGGAYNHPNQQGSTSQLEQEQSGSGTMLDLVFLLDCTGSMGSYIASATKNIELIVENIVSSGKLPSLSALRIGLIAYRDHPPQDNSYITTSHPFTSDIAQVKEDLKKLYASGGGDGPEAVTAAIKAACELDWRAGASKMCVLIADAPAHGIGEYGDGFASGSPDGEDPLQLARQMAAQGITLFCVACEPALSGYQFGLDFFTALTKITSAILVPLTTATLLSHVIVGSALEQMDMERLIEEVGLAVAERVHEGQQDVDSIAKELHEKLLLRNESTKQLVFESIHKDSAEARHNVEVFVGSEDLAAARPLLKKVPGTRFTEKYLQQRYSTLLLRSHVTLHLRLLRHPLPHGSRHFPSRPLRPRRRPVITTQEVISEFKAFGASPGMSMASTPLGSAKSAEEEEGGAGGAGDEMDDLAQTIEMRFGAISLDQAKRITIASAWRSAPPRA